MAKTRKSSRVDIDASDKNLLRKVTKRTKSTKNCSGDGPIILVNSNTNGTNPKETNPGAETLPLTKNQQKKVSKRKKNENIEDGFVMVLTNSEEIKQNVVADILALDRNRQEKVSKQTKKIKKGLEDGSILLKPTHKEMKQIAEQKRGLIYIGHIPHGFYESEMQNYFKQFGRVTNVKVCRSGRTGNSKGFGYIEFEHPEVAKIAAETMNHYVMFKKRVVTAYVPFEKRPKGLFQGKSSNRENTSVKTRRGKQKYSRNKIQDYKTVQKKAKQGFKKFQSKLEKLNSLGIECDLIPLDLSDKTIKKIKTEKKSVINITLGEDTQLANKIVFKKPSYKEIRSKNLTSSSSTPTRSSSKSLNNGIKSNKAILTKSLDSVKSMLKKKHSINYQDEETQTPKLRTISKREKPDRNALLRGGIAKGKRERNTLNLNSDALKKIARELIRKRGNPLLNVMVDKPKEVTKKK